MIGSPEKEPIMLCNVCQEDKDPTEFYKNYRKCKKCRCKETTEWRKNNKEKVSAYRKKNRLENLEAHRKKDKEKRKKNPESHAARIKRYREKYPNRAAEATKRWRDRNHEKVLAKAAEWRKNNRAKCLEYTYKWREKHPDKSTQVIRKAAQVQREKFPEKNKARKMVFSALRIGFLIRPSTCSRCLKECKPHAHHPDYSKPLEVIWLCRSCHNQEHEKDGMSV